MERCESCKSLTLSGCDRGVVVDGFAPSESFGCILHEPIPVDPFVEFLDTKLHPMDRTVAEQSMIEQAKAQYLELKKEGLI